MAQWVYIWLIVFSTKASANSSCLTQLHLILHALRTDSLQSAGNPHTAPSYSAWEFPHSKFSPIDVPVPFFASKQAIVANKVAEACNNGADSKETLARATLIAKLYAKIEGGNSIVNRAEDTGTQIASSDSEIGKGNKNFLSILKTELFQPYDLDKIRKNFGADVASAVENISARFENEIYLGKPKQYLVFSEQKEGNTLVSSIVIKTDHGKFFWIHSPVNHSKKHLGYSHEKLAELRRGKGKNEEGDRLSTFAEATFYYYIAMPFERGSAGIGNSWLAGEFKGAFGKNLPFVDGLDRAAMSLSKSEFIKWYKLQIKTNGERIINGDKSAKQEATHFLGFTFEKYLEAFDALKNSDLEFSKKAHFAFHLAVLERYSKDSFFDSMVSDLLARGKKKEEIRAAIEKISFEIDLSATQYKAEGDLKKLIDSMKMAKEFDSHLAFENRGLANRIKEKLLARLK